MSLPNWCSNPDLEEVHARLCRALRFCSNLYYTDGTSPVPDATYDGWMRMLQSIETVRPDLITPESPTQIVMF